MKRSLLIKSGILGLGIFAWVATGASLEKAGMYEFQPNVMTLKGSPFGRTVAVAMRGPVDVYWNQGEAHSQGGHDCSGSSCAHAEHEKALDPAQPQTASELLNGSRGMAEEMALLSEEDSLRGSILDRIEAWKSAYYTRTNPYGSSRIHKAFIMGETEKRLRLSYEMDPSNFAAYGSYFLFLSEALSSLKEEGNQVAMEARAVESALRLSRHTVRYSLGHSDEPGALLTAAAAAHDYLQLRYKQGGEKRMVEVHQFLRLQNDCLREYAAVREGMVASGIWERLPALRRQEMEVHEYLLNRLHEGNLQMVGRNVISEKSEQEEIQKSS